MSAQSELTGTWSIDPTHSRVGFSSRHAMVTKVRGAFNDVSGTAQLDAEDMSRSKVSVVLSVDSVDTRSPQRDAHLRSADFLNVSKHDTATFESTSVKSTGEGTADVTGNLTLNGVTKPVVIAAKFIGEGKDPWGGYRAGFEGTTTLKLKDFDITKDLGPASETVELIISVEGIRQ